MIYFTSDLHLGHANIIRHCNRPFSSVEEMDDALIDNWNAKVTNADPCISWVTSYSEIKGHQRSISPSSRERSIWWWVTTIKHG